jgi:hypothetical protein
LSLPLLAQSKPKTYRDLYFEALKDKNNTVSVESFTDGAVVIADQTGRYTLLCDSIELWSKQRGSTTLQGGCAYLLKHVGERVLLVPLLFGDHNQNQSPWLELVGDHAILHDTMMPDIGGGAEYFTITQVVPIKK